MLKDQVCDSNCLSRPYFRTTDDIDGTKSRTRRMHGFHSASTYCSSLRTLYDPTNTTNTTQQAGQLRARSSSDGAAVISSIVRHKLSKAKSEGVKGTEDRKLGSLEEVVAPDGSIEIGRKKKVSKKKNLFASHNKNSKNNKNKSPSFPPPPPPPPTPPPHIASSDVSLASISLASAQTPLTASPSNALLSIVQPDPSTLAEYCGIFSSFRPSPQINQEMMGGVQTTLRFLGINSFSTSAISKNAVSEPTGTDVNVRGQGYTSRNGKAAKVGSEENVLAFMGADAVFFPKGLPKKESGKRKGSKLPPAPKPKDDYLCVSKRRGSFVRRFRSRYPTNNSQIVVLNMVLPWGNLVGYYHRPPAPKLSSSRSRNQSNQADQSTALLWDTFLSAPDSWRNERLKLIPRIVTGPWVIRKLVGNTPALIGTKLPVSYTLDESTLNFFEITVDVGGGTKLANKIATGVMGKAGSVCVDMTFVIEGKEEKELPERCVMGLRLHHLETKRWGNWDDYEEMFGEEV